MSQHGSKVIYRQIQPPAYLAEFVDYFWTLKSCGTEGGPKMFGPLADGCPGLIFQQSEHAHLFAPNKKELPKSFIYGQSIRLTHLNLTTNYNVIGIRFFPHALKSIFRFNSSEITDSCIDLTSLLTTEEANLLEKLKNSTSTGDNLHLLSQYLFSLIRKNKSQVDSITEFALSQIIHSKGRVSLKDIQEKLKLSERSLERKFDQFVGIPPKLYARVCRFQAALSQLKNHQYSKLSDIAFDNGFADQSHFIRTFKEFAGYSPIEFQKQVASVGEIVPGP
jgi:AraC-like DNA-binding protein